jgi:16S rRNA (guanine527-N7)-methyltransferase
MFHVEHFGEVVSTCLAEHVHLIGRTLTDPQFNQFAEYADELNRWNQRINLTAITDPLEIAIKHFLDSLFGIVALPRQSTDHLLDVGSGGGFPGIPLKILMPSMSLSLVEPNSKKASFLLHMIGLLRLKNVLVLNRKIEEIVREDRSLQGPLSIAVRGLNIENRLGFFSSILKTGERLILYGTTSWSDLPNQGPLRLLEQIPYQLPLNLGDRMLIVLGKGKS